MGGWQSKQLSKKFALLRESPKRTAMLMNYEDVLSNLTVHHPLPSEVNEHNADEVQSLQESRVYGTSPMKGRRFKLRWMMTWLGLLELACH
mmetsp:Transcript_10034/g.15196  ORF Transcript_10034/g.15196 Transcript_10034/m.15196 type:complete len:91 (-) Transcript_10034:207-479(-)